jgi:hypothetical protein
LLTCPAEVPIAGEVVVVSVIDPLFAAVCVAVAAMLDVIEETILGEERVEAMNVSC